MNENDTPPHPETSTDSRLSNSLSPYLRHHATNPVNWWPYSDDAMQEAQAKDLPLLISIGYSSCHWCHVMEKESFEDRTVADLINAMCIPIKVDREERPDIDAIYMEALLAMSGSGGWPMTIFATPQGRPFFAATYLPKEPRGSMPGFIQLLQAVREAWQSRRSELLEEADRVTEAIMNRSNGTYASNRPQVRAKIEAIEPVSRAVKEFSTAFDGNWGGFGRAPKFPQPHILELLMNFHLLDKDMGSLEIVAKTLDHITRGGIFDHVGGGLFRYSTDRFWIVPHFEKMLYDQAGLVHALTSYFALSGDEDTAFVIDKVHSYVSETLYLPGGGVAASQDADSQGEEGAYYIFRKEEIKEALQDKAHLIIDHYGVTKSGNFEGRNILHRGLDEPLNLGEDVNNCLKVLKEFRSKREAPEVDDKIITEWNAMWISALFYAGRILKNQQYVHEANVLLDFLLRDHTDPDGKVFHTSYHGVRSQFGFINDYAWLLTALLEGFYATGEHSFIDKAKTVVGYVLEHHYDHQHGGFFLSDTTSTLIVNPKEILDGATPSANAVMTRALLRIGLILDSRDILDAVDKTVSWGAAAVSASPSGTASFSLAIYEHDGGLNELVVGDQAPEEVVELSRTRYLPNTILCVGPFGDGPLYQDRDARYAYLCEGYSCKTPTRDATELERILS